MRFPKLICGVLLLFVVTGRASAQKVMLDYDHRANFSQYKTFMWIETPHFRVDPLMDQRVMDSINAALTAKGWQLVPANADVGISAHAATREKHTVETFYDGFGGGWGWRHWGGGFGTATTDVESYTVGTLVIDMFDGHTRQLIWRGAAEETLSDKPEKNTDRVNRAIEKLFKQFPPR
jgi:hypothetical protein